jgi:hypothetical protein
MSFYFVLRCQFRILVFLEEYHLQEAIRKTMVLFKMYGKVILKTMVS